jgi:hypothetical protein
VAKKYLNIGKEVKPENGKEHLDRIGQEGIYKVFLLVASNQSASGVEIIQIALPNREEYDRLNKQIDKVRKFDMNGRWKQPSRVIWYKNNYGDWQSINTIGEGILSITTNATESKVFVKDDKGKESPIIMASSTDLKKHGLPN